MNLNGIRWRLRFMAQRTRRAVLCVELGVRGLPFSVGGDQVAVRIGSLWFEVCPLWGTSGWAVDHPYTDFEDEHNGWEIARTGGVLFPVHLLFDLWQTAVTTDSDLPQ